MASNNQNINPRPCVYNCGIQIYWNSSVNEYWEVFTMKKHICPNRGNKSSETKSTAEGGGITPPSDSPKPRYYNPSAKKRTPHASSFVAGPKPKISNSFELLTGPTVVEIQKKYEILSDIVSEYNGKVHGSQSHIISANSISLVVYFEVSEDKREEVKQKFNNIIRNDLKIYQRN
jgi:hypothetical protein